MTKNRKYFEIPKYVEFVVCDNSGRIGTIRIKPATVMWKPKGAKGATPWLGVSIEDFEGWITTAQCARGMAQ